MAKMTLLDIVQNILSDMDSDIVNSIDDTEEATQVAEIIETTYYEIINDRVWPHLRNIGTLTASGDSNRPTHMSMDDNVQDITWIRYNKRKSTDTKDKFENVTYLEAEEFIKTLNVRDSSASDVTQVTDFSGVVLLVKNDVAPTYWTSFDDENIVFDSYDSVVDSTLQTSKTQIQFYKEPTFTQSDTFVPDLPSKAFPYLLSEAKSVTFNALRQTANQKEEQRSRRQRTWLSREKWRTRDGIRGPDYGRKK